MREIFASILQRCARVYIKRHDPYIIGITGSVGKTSCRMILTQTLRILLPQLKISTSPKNFNSEIGLPLAVLEIENYEPSYRQSIVTIFKSLVRALGPQRYNMIVLEYGIDAPGDMELLVDLVPPQVAIFTALDKVHAHQLGGPDEILAEKSHLLLGAKEFVFYPIDGEYLGPYLSMIEVDKLSYSLHEDLAHDADIGYVSYHLQKTSNGVQTQIALQQGIEQIGHIHTNLIGRSELGYVSLGVSLAMILERRLATELSSHFDEPLTDVSLEYQLQPGRCTILEGIQGSTLIDSSYNAAPASMMHLIRTSIQMRQELFADHELIYCIGDMRELGDYTEREHRNLGAILAQSADRIYLIGESMRSYLHDELLKLGYNQNKIYTYGSSKELGRQLADDLVEIGKPSLILFKGSQNTVFLEDAIPFVLADQGDVSKLCRQSEWWIQKKEDLKSQI